jgi:phosphoglycolate phosphatase
MASSLPALAFDLDGTLVDSAPDITTAVNRLLGELGLPPLTIAAVRRLVGDGIAVLLGRALATAGAVVEDSRLPEIHERYRELYVATATVETRPYPGVLETLARLKAEGHRMVVCTNKVQRSSLVVLEALDLLRFFDGVLGGDQVPARKPDPAHLRAALALAGAADGPAVMIGDGINDVKAAHAAGWPCLLYPSGYGEHPPEALGAELILGKFGEIPAALAKVAPRRQPQQA